MCGSGVWRRVFFYSVKSYTKLEGLFLRENRWSEGERGVFSKVWKSPVPTKVVAFSWKILLNRIPTRQILLLETFFLRMFLYCVFIVGGQLNRPIIFFCIARWLIVCVEVDGVV